jgi:hypothetical protein
LRELAHAAGAGGIAGTEDVRSRPCCSGCCAARGAAGSAAYGPPRYGSGSRSSASRGGRAALPGEAGLPFRIDRTNADLRHARNRLRRLVIPLLARGRTRLGPAIAALATRLRDRTALLDALATERAAVTPRGWARDRRRGQPPALARRIARAWLGDLGLRTTAGARSNGSWRWRAA